MIIAVIEWNEAAIEPAVFVADTTDDLYVAVAEYLAPLARDGSIDYVDRIWARENTPPVFTPDGALEWLNALREETTDAWLTVYRPGREPSPHQYVDLRTNV